MRVALFVEGSAPLGTKDHCARLWNGTLLPALGRAPVDFVVPIGKDAISRLRGFRTSTAGPGLDTKIQALARQEKLDPDLDALVIAWDLEPIDENQRRCAWDEKVGLYRSLAASPLLKGSRWAHDAQRRADALCGLRGRPPGGTNHSRVTSGSVLALCMDPMFESLLARDGRAIRRALGLHADPPDWPSGWGHTDIRDPSVALLERAIDALRRLRPRPRVRRLIRENWPNAKDEWCEYILRQLFADAPQAALLREHPIARRLAHLLPPAS